MSSFSRLIHVRKLTLAVLAAALMLGACDRGGSLDSPGLAADKGGVKPGCADGLERIPWYCRTAGKAGGAGGGQVVAAKASGQWNADQVTNAKTIVAVGRKMGVSRRARVVALAAAMQESSLRNLGHLGDRNDHDSLGLFQQRPSQGWGTPAQVTDPEYAARKFYSALLAVRGWEGMSVTRAAQEVQRSAYPDAYAKWADAAEKLAD